MAPAKYEQKAQISNLPARPPSTHPRQSVLSPDQRPPRTRTHSSPHHHHLAPVPSRPPASIKWRHRRPKPRPQNPAPDPIPIPNLGASVLYTAAQRSLTHQAKRPKSVLRSTTMPHRIPPPGSRPKHIRGGTGRLFFLSHGRALYRSRTGRGQVRIFLVLREGRLLDGVGPGFIGREWCGMVVWAGWLRWGGGGREGGSVVVG